jgi:hypothetical protein
MNRYSVTRHQKRIGKRGMEAQRADLVQTRDMAAHFG